MGARRGPVWIAVVVVVGVVLIAGAIGFTMRDAFRNTASAPTPTPPPTVSASAQATSSVTAPPVLIGSSTANATPTPLAPNNAATPSPQTTASASATPPTTPSTPEAFDPERLYVAVSPAVVTISNMQRINPNAPAMREANAGSGIIYDARGYILTNRHIIDAAERIEVTVQSGKTITATLVGQDPVADLAVIKIDPNIVPGVATLGDSAKVRSGQHVIVIGNPKHYDFSVTRGIISGTDRSIGGLDGMMQTDAEISPGSSGGALVNAAGEVIGIATSTVRTNQAERIGFAIPSNTAKRIAGILVTNGKVARPYMGVTTEYLTSLSADELGVKVSRGAYISDVNVGTPAAKAGLKKDDVIVAINAAKVDRTNPLSLMLLDFKPGDTVMLTINRGGTEQQIPLTFIERPAALDP